MHILGASQGSRLCLEPSRRSHCPHSPDYQLRNKFRFTEVVCCHLGLEGGELSAVLRELYVEMRVCYIEEFCDLLLKISPQQGRILPLTLGLPRETILHTEARIICSAQFLEQGTDLAKRGRSRRDKEK